MHANVMYNLFENLCWQSFRYICIYCAYTDKIQQAHIYCICITHEVIWLTSQGWPCYATLSKTLFHRMDDSLFMYVQCAHVYIFNICITTVLRDLYGTRDTFFLLNIHFSHQKIARFTIPWLKVLMTLIFSDWKFLWVLSSCQIDHDQSPCGCKVPNVAACLRGQCSSRRDLT
jgi:hypothetical protein